MTREAAFGDAYVDADHAAGRWVIGNDTIGLTIRSRGDQLFFEGLSTGASADPVTIGDDPEGLIAVDGDTYRLGAAGGPFGVDAIEAATGSHFVSLSVRLASTRHGLIVTRRYVVYPGAAAVELWTEIETRDEPRTVDTLNAFALVVPAGSADWIAGLDTPDEEGGAFTRRSRGLADGERLALGSPTLSSETTVPYFSIGDGARRFFAGMIWSGAWSASIERHDDVILITAGLPPMSALARPERRIEGPHAFIGAVGDKPGAEIAAVTRFVYAARAGRPFPARTTFNTWFVHGTHIDEDVVRRDIDESAAAGIELLQVDAGWYPGSKPDRFDFTSGLGSWTVDTTRFPSGLAALREYAHNNTVEFGIWVEPERVDMSTVGHEGLAQERFLAQTYGEYEPGVPNEEARQAQICLADPTARAWVLAQLTRLIEGVGPDNLKWDLNWSIVCTREGHGHPVNGGNFEHTRGLYEILAELRQRYPGLAIENCSGGARRLDFAMARLTDTAWMDDRTAPSAHVRYNLQGLVAAFPAPYLFSYVITHPEEPLKGNEDIPMLVRSRMPGVVGLTVDFHTLGERELNELHQQIELAKRLRPLQAGAVTYTLTPQARADGEWNVIQQALSDGGHLIFAFSNGARDPIRVFLRDINVDQSYELRSADRGRMGVVRGEELIAGGLEILEAPESAAQVLVLDPVSTPGRVE